MLKRRMKRVADRGAHAVEQFAQIEASIAALNDEDLLDLADIFSGQPGTPLSERALSEMAKRNISLS